MNNKKSQIEKLLLLITLIFDIDVFIYSTRGILAARIQLCWVKLSSLKGPQPLEVMAKLLIDQ